MKRVIDADTHIPESEATWSTFDKESLGALTDKILFDNPRRLYPLDA